MQIRADNDDPHHHKQISKQSKADKQATQISKQSKADDGEADKAGKQISKQSKADDGEAPA